MRQQISTRQSVRWREYHNLYANWCISLKLSVKSLFHTFTNFTFFLPHWQGDTRLVTKMQLQKSHQRKIHFAWSRGLYKWNQGVPGLSSPWLMGCPGSLSQYCGALLLTAHPARSQDLLPILLPASLAISAPTYTEIAEVHFLYLSQTVVPLSTGEDHQDLAL